MMSDERAETYEQAMNFYRCIGRDMGLEEETLAGDSDMPEGKKCSPLLARFFGESHRDIPQVRMENLTIAELWDCVEALMVLVDTRANKDLYKATGEYKDRKRDAWVLAEEALKNAGLMEIPE